MSVCACPSFRPLRSGRGRRRPAGFRPVSITRRRRHRAAPQSAAGPTRVRLGALQLRQARERRSRRDARQSFAHEHGVHQHAVLGDDIRRPTRAHVGAVAFETHPAIEHERGESIPRFARKRHRRTRSASERRRGDAGETHVADRDDVDRVAGDHAAHEHGIGSCRRIDARRCGNGSNDEQGDDLQKIHTRLHAAGDSADRERASASA
jgi:hypothetical protein